MVLNTGRHWHVLVERMSEQMQDRESDGSRSGVNYEKSTGL